MSGRRLRGAYNHKQRLEMNGYLSPGQAMEDYIMESTAFQEIAFNMKFKLQIKDAIKGLLGDRWPLLPSMKIDNVYVYLDALWHKRNVEGPVVEVGCGYGGTTLMACHFLSRIGCKKQYYCIDTFCGFVDDQLKTDHKLGLTVNHDRMFSSNSLKSFKRNLCKRGIFQNIHIIQGNICNIDEICIPHNISVCLIDVDLHDPTYEGLKLISKHMSKNGIVLVDDCKEGTSWVGANAGYMDFIEEEKMQPKYYMGFGVVEFTADAHTMIPWQYSISPKSIPRNYYGT